VIAEMRAGQELRREIGHHLGVRLQQEVDSLEIAIEQTVANGERERHVPVVAAGELRGNRLLVVQVVGHGGSDRLFPEAGSNRALDGHGYVGGGLVAVSGLHDYLTLSSDATS
jgi:hypothetical protein